MCSELARTRHGSEDFARPGCDPLNIYSTPLPPCGAPGMAVSYCKTHSCLSRTRQLGYPAGACRRGQQGCCCYCCYCWPSDKSGSSWACALAVSASRLTTARASVTLVCPPPVHFHPPEQTLLSAAGRASRSEQREDQPPTTLLVCLTAPQLVSQNRGTAHPLAGRHSQQWSSIFLIHRTFNRASRQACCHVSGSWQRST